MPSGLQRVSARALASPERSRVVFALAETGKFRSSKKHDSHLLAEVKLFTLNLFALEKILEFVKFFLRVLQRMDFLLDRL